MDVNDLGLLATGRRAWAAPRAIADEATASLGLPNAAVPEPASVGTLVWARKVWHETCTSHLSRHQLLPSVSSSNDNTAVTKPAPAKSVFFIRHLPDHQHQHDRCHDRHRGTTAELKYLNAASVTASRAATARW